MASEISPIKPSKLADRYDIDGTKYGAYVTLREALIASFVDEDADEEDPFSEFNRVLYDNIALTASGYATPKSKP
jgi:hypothetical protein